MTHIYAFLNLGLERDDLGQQLREIHEGIRIRDEASRNPSYFWYNGYTLFADRSVYPPSAAYPMENEQAFYSPLLLSKQINAIVTTWGCYFGPTEKQIQRVKTYAIQKVLSHALPFYNKGSQIAVGVMGMFDDDIEYIEKLPEHNGDPYTEDLLVILSIFGFKPILSNDNVDFLRGTVHGGHDLGLYMNNLCNGHEEEILHYVRKNDGLYRQLYQWATPLNVAILGNDSMIACQKWTDHPLYWCQTPEFAAVSDDKGAIEDTLSRFSKMGEAKRVPSRSTIVITRNDGLEIFGIARPSTSELLISDNPDFDRDYGRTG